MTLDGNSLTAPIVQLLKDSQPDPIIDASVANTTYYGYAVLGTLTSAPNWMIKKVVVASNVTTTTYADGDMQYDNIWDNRTTLTYSR